MRNAASLVAVIPRLAPSAATMALVLPSSASEPPLSPLSGPVPSPLMASLLPVLTG
jgi:hypothetical protein